MICLRNWVNARVLLKRQARRIRDFGSIRHVVSAYTVPEGIPSAGFLQPHMTRIVANNTAKRSLIAGISLVVIFCATKTANASCGDYLHTKATRVAGTENTPPARATGVPALDSRRLGSANGAPGGAVPPCSGPHCRESNESAPPVVPPLTLVPPLREALASARLPTAQAGVAWCRFAESGAAPLAGYPARPERPPQTDRFATGM